MVLAIYVSFFAISLFAMLAPVCARCLPPRAATWALSLGSVVTAGAALLSLLLLSLSMLASSARTLAAVVAAVLLTLAAGRGVWFWRGHRCAVDETRALGAGLPVAADDLAVVDDVGVYAFALPGAGDRIVVSRGLLGCLAPAEQRAVIAHERAHLRRGHHWHLTAVQLAAAMAPILVTVPKLTEFTTERWADETAADECSRAVVRSALLRVCAAQSGPAPAAGTLGVASSHVLTRVAALAVPPARTGRGWALAVAALLLLTTASAAEATRDAHELFERPPAGSTASK